jgi:hypothetical protein
MLGISNRHMPLLIIHQIEAELPQFFVLDDLKVVVGHLEQTQA